MTVTITAFYKFVAIENCAALREGVRAACVAHAIKGSVLIAPEGINATVSGPDAGIAAFLAGLRSDSRFSDIVSKQSFAEDHPFQRLKVRLKREIVTLGVPQADPARAAGVYVKPEDWNALLAQDGVTLIDTRNAYEVAIGSFEGAIDPGTKAFGEFPAYVKANLDPTRHKRIAMFCTGGIRCEKASAYMLGAGFAEVYHLEGGILKYLETVPKEESLWRGECFVFDARVALEYGVRGGTHVMCPDCGCPIPKSDTARRNASGAQLCEDCAAG